MTELYRAIEIVKIGAAGRPRAFRAYDGSIWIGRNEGMRNGHFDDWGLASAVVEILNAVATGRLEVVADVSGGKQE